MDVIMKIDFASPTLKNSPPYSPLCKRGGRGGFNLLRSQFKRCIDLENLCGSHADDIRDARFVAYFAEGFLQRLLIRCNESEPDIVFIASSVIVRDTGIGVYNCDELFQFFFGNLGGAQGARIAHLFGVKDSTDPADDSFFLQIS